MRNTLWLGTWMAAALLAGCAAEDLGTEPAGTDPTLESVEDAFVVADGKAQRKEVKIGGREPGQVAVLAGIDAGDTIIVEGTQRVRNGGKVIAKPRP